MYGYDASYAFEVYAKHSRRFGLIIPVDPGDPAVADTIADWAANNVAIKVTGACTLSHERFPYNGIWDPLSRIFDAFGLERCPWGTDWTRACALLSYEQGRGFPGDRTPVGQRPRHADGRGADPRLQLDPEILSDGFIRR